MNGAEKSKQSSGSGNFGSGVAVLRPTVTSDRETMSLNTEEKKGSR